MNHTATFEEAWPELDKRLHGALAGRRVPADLRDDIVQETALRLFRTWDTVKPESTWAFTLTIAINLVRDEIRRQQRQDPSRLEAPSHQRDAEQDALVRIELQKVADALSVLTERQRAILLAEVGEDELTEPEGSALKMARMRARRRLKTVVEQASAAVIFGLERMRRIFGATEAMAAAGASSIGRPMAAFGIAAAGVLGVWGPDTAAILGQGPGSSVTSVGRADDSIVDAVWSSATHGRDLPDRAPSTRRAGVNESFGSSSSGGGIVIDPEGAQIGPYEAEQEVAPSTFGEEETAVRVEVRHEGAQCDPSGPTSVCTGAGSGSVVVEVVVAGEEHEFKVGTTKVGGAH